MTDLPWPAPAKLNLFLHVTGRRPDGYHTLQTLFQFLSVQDEIRVASRADGAIRLTRSLPGLDPEQDLVVRAACLLQQAAGVPQGAELTVTKRLPLGGGLGGGSSDAATTLVALNCLWGLGWSQQQLADLGLQLGADVPVFVHGHAAWAEGVGEQLTPLEPPEPWYVVLVPECHVSTAAVFSDPELTRDSPLTTISAFRSGEGRNDCEPVVRRRYPSVARALDVLAEVGDARLTGTGACVFAPFQDETQAAGTLKHCRAEGLRGFVARGVNRSPLLDRLQLEMSGCSA